MFINSAYKIHDGIQARTLQMHICFSQNVLQELVALCENSSLFSQIQYLLAFGQFLFFKTFCSVPDREMFS